MKEKKLPCQKKSVGFDLKLKIIDEVCNGQISVNHASVKYQVGRNAIYYWLQKFATLEQKQKGMSNKDEIKKLKQKIEELEFIKDFQQMIIAEAEIDTGNDYAKKSLPESLAKEVEQKKKAILKSNGSANASGYHDKPSTKK
jgi:transposase-like protein